MVVERRERQARYVPDPRPVREQRGGLQDAVALPAVALSADRPTAVVQRQQALALEAVSVALGQKGRLDRPEARRLASELAGRSPCPAPARESEAAVAAHFARRQLDELWPRRSSVPAPPPAGKKAATQASAWVDRPVQARESRLDDAVRALPAASPASAGRPGAAPVLESRPVPVPMPGADSPAPARAR